MASTPVLIWPALTRSLRYRYLRLCVRFFTTVFASYAIGVFYVSGGIFRIPYYAAVVRMLTAVGISYARKGFTIA